MNVTLNGHDLIYIAALVFVVTITVTNSLTRAWCEAWELRRLVDRLEAQLLEVGMAKEDPTPLPGSTEASV